MKVIITANDPGKIEFVVQVTLTLDQLKELRAAAPSHHPWSELSSAITSASLAAERVFRPAHNGDEE